MNPLFPFLLIVLAAFAASSPAERQGKQVHYMFYLHGGIIQEEGINAVSAQFGKYEYRAILDTLAANGFRVISEPRAKETEDIPFAMKIKGQIDSLVAMGVQPRHISVVGASAGAYIALEAALINDHPDLKFALIGLCSEYALGYFSNFSQDLDGDFLSIYERSDSKKSCASLFSRPAVRFQEVAVDMGIDHGFLYQPYDEWVRPLVKWAKE